MSPLVWVVRGFPALPAAAGAMHTGIETALVMGVAIGTNSLLATGSFGGGVAVGSVVGGASDVIGQDWQDLWSGSCEP